MTFAPAIDDPDGEDVRLAALRALLDDGVRELDGLGVETTPEDPKAVVLAEVGLDRSAPAPVS